MYILIQLWRTKRLQIEDFFLHAEKRIQKWIAWFLAIAATSHLKEQTPTWISIKIANEASSYYISSCSNHQPFSVIFSKHFFLQYYTLFCSNHQPEFKMKQEKWSNPPLNTILSSKLMIVHTDTFHRGPLQEFHVLLSQLRAISIMAICNLEPLWAFSHFSMSHFFFWSCWASTNSMYFLHFLYFNSNLIR